MNFIFYKQKPKRDKKGFKGTLSVHSLQGKETTAMFFQEEQLIAELNKPDIIFINPHGILLKGYEPMGVDKQGRQKFNYQEWFCAFVDETLKEQASNE